MLKIKGIAVSVSGEETAREIKNSGADLLEVRLDAFRNLGESYILKKIEAYKKTGLPVILTIRAKDEGGRTALSDEKRLALFRSLTDYVDAIDIELESTILKDAVFIARKHKKALIVSWHNFKSTPAERDLEKIYKKARSAGDIVKIAVMANSREDVLRLLRWTLKHRGEPLATISLGKIGAVSRLILSFCGSLVTYTYLKKPFAPGQIACAELVRQFKIYNLTER